MALGSDLPTLWQAPTTTNAERKQMLRLVIRDVIVDGKRAHGQVWVQINWQTGAYEEFCYKRSVRSYEASADVEAIEQRVRELNAAGLMDAQIAAKLTAEGYRTARLHRLFTGKVVWLLRQKWGISTVKTQRERAQSCSVGRWHLLSRRGCSSAGSLSRDHSQMAEGGQTHRIPTRQRNALEGIFDRRRYDTAPRMASTSKTIKERGIMMHSRK